MIVDNINFQTPEWVCDILISQIRNNPKTILEPASGCGILANRLESKLPNSVIIRQSDDFLTVKPFKCDQIVTNPPFTPMVLGYKMLERFFLFTKNIIVLMPWLTIINSQKRTEWIKDSGLRRVIHLPRNAFKGSRVQTCVLVFEDGYSGDVSLIL